MRLLRRADAGCVRDRRDVLLARQGDHDEGQPPHRLRPRGQDLLQGRLRQAPGAVRRLGRQRQQWLVRSVQQDRVAAGVATRRDHRGPTPLPRTPPRARDGRFGQRYLQLPLAERCDRGRLDARDDSRGRQDVWRRRKAQGHQGGQPGVHLLAHLSGDHQLLQDKWPVRSDDDGHRPQCGSDGPAGRGVRLARQDVRDSRGRRRQHRRCRHRRGAADRERGSRRHLAHVHRQGRTDP